MLFKLFPHRSLLSFIIRPLFEKTLSQGTDVPGMHKYLACNLYNLGKVLPFLSFQKLKGSEFRDM